MKVTITEAPPASSQKSSAAISEASEIGAKNWGVKQEVGAGFGARMDTFSNGDIVAVWLPGTDKPTGLSARIWDANSKVRKISESIMSVTSNEFLLEPKIAVTT